MSAPDGRPRDPWADSPPDPDDHVSVWTDDEDDASEEGDQPDVVVPTGPVSRHEHDQAPPDPLPDSIAYALAALDRDTPALRGLERELAQVERVVVAAKAWRFRGHTYGRRTLTEGQICRIVREHTTWGRRVLTGGVGGMVCTAVVDHLDEATRRDPTELGLARRLVDRHGCDIAWTPSLGHWRVWDDVRWRDDDGSQVRHQVAQIVTRVLAEEAATRHQAAADAAVSLERLGKDAGLDAKATAEATVKASAAAAKAAAAFARQAQGALFARHAIEWAQSLPGVGVRPEDWDERPDVLATADGVVALDTDRGALVPRPACRADRLTRTTRAGAAAWASGVPDGGPWLRFVRAVFPDPEVRDWVQRLLGYSLLGDNRLRIMVVIIGGTSTGKSTLMRVVTDVLGDYAGSFELTLLRGKREEGPRADLVNALPRRFLGTTEASDRWRLHGDAIKRMTGGDAIQARTLHSREHVERRPAFTPWIATNAAPQVVGVDEALWRRLIVVPMDARVRAEDPDLAERLCADADAVLAWLLDGFTDYARHGLGHPPQACRDAAEELRADLSLVDAWLRDDTVSEPDAEALPDDLAASWQAWCRRQDVPPAERLSSVALGKELHARGYRHAFRGPKVGRKRVRLGLRLRESEGHGLRVVES